MPRVAALDRQYEKTPPLHLIVKLIAMAVGVEFAEPSASTSDVITTDAEFGALLSQIQEKPK